MQSLNLSRLPPITVKPSPLSNSAIKSLPRLLNVKNAYPLSVYDFANVSNQFFYQVYIKSLVVLFHP